MTETEYLKHLVEINGSILAELGSLIARHLPEMMPSLVELGNKWVEATTSLDNEYYDSPKDGQQHRIIVP